MARPKGIPHTEEWKRKMSARMSGTGNPFHGRTHSLTTKELISQNNGNKGKKPWNWRGVSSFHHLIRGTAKWANWRKEVYERDGYKCLDCGSSVALEPHHILPVRDKKHRHLLFNSKNGITLCRECHQKTFRKEEELARTYFSLIPNS